MINKTTHNTLTWPRNEWSQTLAATARPGWSASWPRWDSSGPHSDGPLGYEQKSENKCKKHHIFNTHSHLVSPSPAPPQTHPNTEEHVKNLHAINKQEVSAAKRRSDEAERLSSSVRALSGGVQSLVTTVKCCFRPMTNQSLKENRSACIKVLFFSVFQLTSIDTTHIWSPKTCLHGLVWKREEIREGKTRSSNLDRFKLGPKQNSSTPIKFGRYSKMIITCYM